MKVMFKVTAARIWNAAHVSERMWMEAVVAYAWNDWGRPQSSVETVSVPPERVASWAGYEESGITVKVACENATPSKDIIYIKLALQSAIREVLRTEIKCPEPG
jgi:hypothetical protein